MSDIQLYRIARNGEGTYRGPYDRLSTARNAASNTYGGGSWEGVNVKLITEGVYDWKLGERSMVENRYTIQKLTPVFKQIHPSGAFMLSMEWINLG